MTLQWFTFLLGRHNADHLADTLVQRAVIAAHARKHGRVFIYASEVI